jgi:hypothetical protein
LGCKWGFTRWQWYYKVRQANFLFWTERKEGKRKYNKTQHTNTYHIFLRFVDPTLFCGTRAMALGTEWNMALWWVKLFLLVRTYYLIEGWDKKWSQPVWSCIPSVLMEEHNKLIWNLRTLVSGLENWTPAPRAGIAARYLHAGNQKGLDWWHPVSSRCCFESNEMGRCLWSVWTGVDS